MPATGTGEMASIINGIIIRLKQKHHSMFDVEVHQFSNGVKASNSTYSHTVKGHDDAALKIREALTEHKVPWSQFKEYTKIQRELRWNSLQKAV
jgi:hypothetical protein